MSRGKNPIPIDYHEIIMEEHKRKIILEFKQEREKLKKRIKYIEMHLDGMGIREYEITDEDIIRNIY